MRKGLIALAALALVACKKTGENEYEVVRPGLVTDTVTTPTVGTKVDTITTPTVGTEKDTIIVNKPTVGTKQTEVKTPTVKKP
ncbi:MAG: hypothetical protein WD825_06110 [Gemmatimonadaceae bacterium]